MALFYEDMDYLEDIKVKIVMDCPNCGQEISSFKSHEQDWFYCQACAAIFFSNESLRENWPSVFEALAANR